MYENQLNCYLDLLLSVKYLKHMVLNLTKVERQAVLLEISLRFRIINPSNAWATFVQRTSTQQSLKSI